MSSILDVSTLYQNLLNLRLSEEQEASGHHLSRRHSACSSDTPYSSSSSSGDPNPGWPLHSHWSPGTELPPPPSPRPVGEPGRRPALRPDRSVSLIEGKALLPPPGFPPLRLGPPAPSSRYKTELCRTYSETGRCKYGAKCQFAHGPSELRSVSRHPKYKTELCHKFYLQGECPYGSRCHFIHYPDEAQLAQPSASTTTSPQLLRQSVSYSGVPVGRRSSPLPSLPDLASFARAPSVSPPPTSTDLLSPTFSPLNSDPIALLSSLVDPPPPTPAGGGCCSCRCGKTPASLPCPPLARRESFPAAPAASSILPRTPSANSLSDPDCYSSSSSLSGSDSPVFDLQAPSGLGGNGHRLPIFNRLSVSE
ncbi:hypothetical protein JRQ81_011518 [Phrynocephalus forsythii]|uniref:mRNA decay activator protein ZFP36 n=1 Tax=Phrynocephalus forsythii TaxID=171643 RepID=A0A9Q0X984_9SAUR|nr:hypothetical protein JRQ81_011518 [Phrynocephalus forsythii]